MIFIIVMIMTMIDSHQVHNDRLGFDIVIIEDDAPLSISCC